MIRSTLSRRFLALSLVLLASLPAARLGAEVAARIIAPCICLPLT